jgi:hypothetical protein
MAFCTVALFAQPTVNGDLSDSDYMSIATKQNSNAGFGGAIDVTEIVYYPDFTNSVLYLGVKGKLDTGADNGMGLFLDIGGTGSPNGAAAGTELGFDGAGHFMDGEGSGTNDNFKADFEVDYMFAFNPGNGNTTVFWDASSLVGGTTAEYQGSCDQSGTAATNSNAAGGIFTQNSITFAFNNSGGANTGLELSIPFSELGASVAMNINVFTFIVSSSAFFSDVTVPGNVTTGNPGFNADFSTLSGGPYNSGTQALPVELTSFTASAVGNEVTLNWQTATELNNLGFEIQRAAEENDWTVIGFVQGAGNSEVPRVYSYTDNAVFSGTYSYRLKQIDTDGSFQYSPVVQVEVVEIPNGFVLEQNYPNPFNPSTLIKFGVENQSEGTLKVFNTNGEEVAELFAGTLNAGRIYEVEFNGDGLASGMYLYKLQTAEKVEVKKMMLLK